MNKQGNKIDGKKVNFQSILSALGNTGPLLALIMVVIVWSVLTDSFLTANNLLSVLKQSSAQFFVALGMLLAILTGGIDLSIGSMMALSMVIMGEAIQAGWNPYVCMLICVVTGTVLGFLNGFMYTKGKLPHPYIVTLGTLSIYRGICLIITHGTPVSGMPEEITFWGNYSIGNVIPISIIVVLIFYLIWWFMLTRTVFGRHLYAVGGNVSAARLAGVNVDRVLILTYTLSGLACGIAGLLLCGRTDSIFPNAGLSWETNAIAAVIIGGASFLGGRGTVTGTFIGVLLISTITNGLNILGISSDWQTTIIGAMIIISVFIDVVRGGGFRSIKSMRNKDLSDQVNKKE